MGVSILVFVELALDATTSGLVPQWSSTVSILVFVELALDGLVGAGNSVQGACFNPCFRGTCS